MIEETGNTNYEPSDAEDPEQKLRDLAPKLEDLAAEGADQRAMAQAVNGALECRKVLQDMERARMQLEDLKSGLLLR